MIQLTARQRLDGRAKKGGAVSNPPSGLETDLFAHGGERDPQISARGPARSLPKRFYAQVTVGETAQGFGIMLDARPVFTPRKHRVIVPNRALAGHLASEWATQTTSINPATMPLTRLTNTALDGVASQYAAVEAEVMRFAASDLICYRVEEPETLAKQQAAAWDPILAFLKDRLGVRLNLGAGVTFIDQSPETLAALTDGVRESVKTGACAPFRLAAMYELTALSGSLGLALALAHEFLSVEAAWAAANLDEDFQMRVWGEDHEALARREKRFSDFRAAAVLFFSLN